MGFVARVANRWIAPWVLLADRTDHAVPAELGLNADEVEIWSGPRRLHGLWIRGAPDSPAILFCPGNSANLSGHLAYVELLARSGAGVLAFDYSGFGRSEGRTDLAALVPDALAALDVLRALAGPARKLGAFGVSLGANVALEAAARRGEVGAVAVEGVSIQREVMRGILKGGAMGPHWVRSIVEQEGAPSPRALYQISRRRVSSPLAAFLSGIASIFYPFHGKDPRRAARRLDGRPVFLIHGLHDRLLPFEAAASVKSLLRGPGRLWLIPEAGHAQEAALACDEEYALQLGSFYREALGTGLRQPRLTWRSAPSGARFSLEVELSGPAGAYLVTVLAGAELRLLRLWVEGKKDGEDGTVRWTGECPAEAAGVHALRCHLAERRGASWAPLASERGEVFGRVGPVLRRLSAALTEGRLAEADQALAGLESSSLPPAFDLIRRLQRARRDRLGPAAPSSKGRLAAPLAAPLLLAAALVLAGGCGSPPSPFTDLGPLPPGRAEEVIRERANAVHSLYAVVRVAMDTPDMSGTFDVACHYERPGNLRMSAFHSFLIATRPLFDIVFRGDSYSLAFYGDGPPELRRGKLDRLPEEEPRMAELYWLREAMFLPWEAVARGAAGGLVSYRADSRTLEIQEAAIRPPGRAHPIVVQYGEYRLVGGAYIPGLVSVRSPDAGVRMEGRLQDVEVNPPIDPSVFELDVGP